MKRPGCFLLAAVLLLLLPGCAGMFDREYYVVEEYEVPSEQTEPEEADAAEPISNYASLRRAIMRLISEHTESAQLQFQNYEGTLSQDISTACWEVKSSTALGAFAVDYISYDLSRIVSYYQAEIHITYKRAAWQVEAIEKASNTALFTAKMNEALRSGDTYIVLEINAAAVTGDTVRETLAEAYYADPLVCPVLPQAETGLFPESGVDRILEISLDYGIDGEALAARREEIRAALEAMTAEPEQTEPDEEAAPAGEAEKLAVLCDTLRGACEFAPEGGNTAWDALIQGVSDSEGAAMAFEALCRSADIGCVVVSGRVDGEPHFWNIVTVDGMPYHLDVTTWGGETDIVFLQGDETLLSIGYWWDNSQYPVCADAYDSAAETDTEPSGEAS